MDFKKRKYYLVCKDGERPELPYILKTIFPCKIHNGNYYYNETRYTIIVSIDSKLEKRLVGYLHIIGCRCWDDYEEITKLPYYQDKRTKRWIFGTKWDLYAEYYKEERSAILKLMLELQKQAH